MSDYPKSCVIGAGPSGITACKALRERGLPYDCFEMSDDIGGVWYYNNPNGRSAAYRSLHINTSKSVMAFSDYPMPEWYPNYTSHREIHDYFRGYAEHFGVRDTVTFNTAVQHCAPQEGGGWAVTLSTGETRLYDFLWVCNGHHWDPQWPDPPYPGSFDGEQMHSHDYRTPDQVAGRKVLLVGMGNSALDIAVEASYVSDEVWLSTRRGHYVLPKFLLGRPTDLWVNPHVPASVAQRMFAFMLRLQVGKLENYGLPRPQHRLLESHPTISGTILDRIAHGAVVPKPGIERLDVKTVHLKDGSTVTPDLIIWCTGYKVSFPFFDPGFLSAPNNDLPLYHRMWKPDRLDLAFIGLFQPLGAIFPLAEIQAVVAAERLAGRVHLPSREEMEADIEAERQAMFKRYYNSPRHTMQVDFHPFRRQLERDLKQGRRGASAAGHTVPVAARTPAGAPTA